MFGVFTQFFSDKRSVEQREVALDASINPPMAETNGESDQNISPGRQNSGEKYVFVSTDAGPDVSNPVTVSSTEAVSDPIDERCVNETQTIFHQPCEVEIKQETGNIDEGGVNETQTIVNQPCEVVINQATEGMDERDVNETQTIVNQPCEVVINQETESIDEIGVNETQTIANQPCEVVMNQETEIKSASTPVVDELDTAAEAISETDKVDVMSMKTRSTSSANKKSSNVTAVMTRRRKGKSNTFTEHSDSGQLSKGDISAPDGGLVKQGKKRRLTLKQEHPLTLEEKPVDNVKAKRGRRARATKPVPSAPETTDPSPDVSENGLDKKCENETQTHVNQPCEVVINQATGSIGESGVNETQTIINQPCEVVINQETESIDEIGVNETQTIANQTCNVVLNQETEIKSASVPVVDELDTAAEAISETDKVDVMSMKTRSSSSANKKSSNVTAVVTRRRKGKSNTFTEHSDSGQVSKGDISAPDGGLVKQGKKRRLTPKHERPPALEEKPVDNVNAKRGRRARATKPEPSALETTGPSPDVSENGLDKKCENETQTHVNQPCEVVINQETESIDASGVNETKPIINQPCEVVINQETESIDEIGVNETQTIANQTCNVVLNQETEIKSASVPVVDELDTAAEAISETDKVDVMSMKTRSSSSANKKSSNGTAVVTRRRKGKSNTFTEHSDSGQVSKGDISAPDGGLVKQGKKSWLTPKHERPPALEEKPVDNVKAKRGRRARATKPELSVLETTGPSPEVSENDLQQPSGSAVKQLEDTERESTEIPSEDRVPEKRTPSVSNRSVAPKRRRVQKQVGGSGHERRTTRSRKNASEVEPAIDALHKEREVSAFGSPMVRSARRASHAAFEKISFQIAEDVVSDDEETSREEQMLSPSKTKSSGEKRKRSSEGEVSSPGDVVLATPSSRTVQPTDLDVRCIRSTSHPRTKLFWDLIVRYASVSPSLSRKDIAEEIKQGIMPGRLLRTDANGCSMLQTEGQIEKMIGNAVQTYRRRLKVLQAECSNYDVISAIYSKHPGNFRFRDLVTKYMQESPTMTTTDLVELVKKDISPGRFLTKSRFGWCPLPEAQILARVANERAKWTPVARRSGDVATTHMTNSDQNTIAAANNNDEAVIPQASLSVFEVTTVSEVINEKDIANAARSKAREELAMKDSDDLLSSYVEDIAWRKFATEGPTVETVRALPPPGPLPEVMTMGDEPSCTWSFDEESRILRATLKPDVDTLSQKAKDHLLLMMERDDIAVITSGLCRGLERSLWNDEGIISTSGEMYHHRFRRFVRIDVDGTTSGDRKPTPQYEEIDKDLSMKIGDYFKYLEGRLKLIDMAGEKETAQQHLSYTNAGGEATTLDLDEVIYMLDYDIKRKLPLHYQNFKDRFLFPEILPGGSMCAMHAVNEAARPDMGPNLYITPPGSFTRFHKDGYGTVDSGHLCLSGYNEVVMLRRLPKGHDVNALHADVNGFFEMPHADLLGKKKSDWPSKAQIKRMASFNYCPIVLILKPGEHLHIGKGRFHAFRKLGPEALADDDCHSELRKEVHLAVNPVELATCVNFSIAWDWSFLGFTPDGINREMTATLEMALRNRMLSKPKQSLAIPKLCLLACCKSSIAALRPGRSTFGINTTIDARAEQRHRSILKGLLPTLEFVISQEQEAFRTSASDQVSHELRPHSWENPVVFPLDPYGNSDYFCKICFQELSNTYLHCSGCEDLLKKDFNICAECHSASRHHQFLVMNDKDYAVDSSLNHTGAFSQTNPSCGKCKMKERCGSCLRGRRCCCICHERFTLQQRMWNGETLSEMLEAAKKLVAGESIPFYAEVIPRLEEARVHKDIETVHVEQVAFFGNSSGPADHLDISPESLALTTPLSTVELPSIAGTRFAVDFSAQELKDFLTNARNAQDVNGIPGMEPDVARQLFRNFSDCEDTELSDGASEGTLRFSRRELDIIAFAIMQGRDGVPCPFPGSLGKSVRGNWGSAAWLLMPYRERKSVVDRFYKRTSSSSHIEDKFPLENAEYKSHLQNRVSALFASAAQK